VEVRRGVRVRKVFTLEFAHIPIMPSLFLHLLKIPRDAIIHVHVGVAYAPEVVWLYCKILRRPYVAHYHLDVDPSGRLGWLFVLYKRYILSLVLRSAAKVIAVSADQPDFLASKHGVKAESVALLPNGVGARFVPVDRTPPGDCRPLKILFVGRLAQQKNIPLLLAGISRMERPADLVIVGEGEEREAIEGLISDLGLENVTLVGGKHGDELLSAYYAADVLVMTSVKESTGLVLLEAFATGLPVVATDAPGVRGTVGLDGLLPPPLPAALAAYLDLLASDQQLWSDLAGRSKKRASMHAWDVTIDRLEALYDEVYVD
jgi:glycosyltransferase involved in cell wall biosynthesis